jgi:hypothetical protein
MNNSKLDKLFIGPNSPLPTLWCFYVLGTKHSNMFSHFGH